MIDFPHKIVIFSVKLLSSSSLFHSPVTFSILFSSYPFFLHFLAMRFSACSNFCWSLLPGNTHTLAHCQFKPLSNGQMLGPMDLSKKRWFRLITMLMSWFNWSFTHQQIHFMKKKTNMYFNSFFLSLSKWLLNHRAMPSASSRQPPVSLQSWELEIPTHKNVCTPLGTRICSCSRYIHWRWMAYNPLSCCHSTSYLFLICMFFQLIL